MGHAMRSRVVLEYLVSQGHEVHIMASQRAVNYLSKRFEGVQRIHGLQIITEENRVRKGKTVWANVLAGTTALPKQIAAYFKLIEQFQPELVICDFESWAYFYAKLHRLPVFSIDNMQIINRCKHPPEIVQGERQNFEITRAFVKGKLPFCDHYFITTFFYPEVRKERTTLVPPILRPEILETRPSKGDHLLVYQTAEGHGALADTLARTNYECRIYGMRRSIEEEQVEGNLRYRPFSERQFIADLASARAVIAGGGFTLLGECVYLHKPVLSVPIAGQFEQVLNGRYIQHEGYGRHARHIDEPVVQDFLQAVPECEQRLAHYQQNGNGTLFRALDEHLDRVSAGVY